jgi:hypothetical protein
MAKGKSSDGFKEGMFSFPEPPSSTWLHRVAHTSFAGIGQPQSIHKLREA